MTPESKFNQEVWWLLQEIKKERLLTPEGKEIEFSLRKSEGNPSPETQSKLIHLLAEWKGIKSLEIRDRMYLPGISQFPPRKFSFFLVKSNFDRLYEKYKKLTDGVPKQAIKTESKPAVAETEKTPQYVSSPTSAIAKRLIEKDSNGDYLYNGKRIEMGQETTYYKALDILFMQGDQSGFVSYENIELGFIKRGLPESENQKARNKRVNNAAINEEQGLFRFAKVNGERLRNQTPDGRKLVQLIRGKGLRLNNPVI